MEELVMECNKNKLIALLISIVVTACNHDGITTTGLIYLNCAKAENKEAPELSILLKNIRYVALETNDSCLLNNPSNIILTDKYIVMDGGDKTECFVFDKKDGKYLRTIGMRNNEGPTGYYMYPLNDSTMLQYANNHFGNRKYGLQVCTWSGNILKRFSATNNFDRDKRMEYLISYHNEICFYTYNDDVYFHEFTSDTIFRMNKRLEGEPVYVMSKGDKIPVPELRNEIDQEAKFKKLIKFEYLMETDRHLLMMGNRWNKSAYIYDKQTGETIRLEDEQAVFTNDLNGFLPFWPIDRGRGEAKNEVWALIRPDQYMEGVEATGVNPLGFDLKFDDNPVIVIGTLK